VKRLDYSLGQLPPPSGPSLEITLQIFQPTPKYQEQHLSPTSPQNFGTTIEAQTLPLIVFLQHLVREHHEFLFETKWATQDVHQSIPGELT